MAAVSSTKTFSFPGRTAKKPAESIEVHSTGIGLVSRMNEFNKKKQTHQQHHFWTLLRSPLVSTSRQPACLMGAHITIFISQESLPLKQDS